MAHTSRTRGIDGEKAQRIVALYTEHPTWSRQQIADEALCSTARVGEVVRYLTEHEVLGAPSPGVVVWLPGTSSKDPFVAVEHRQASKWVSVGDGRLDIFGPGGAGEVGLVATYAPHSWISVAQITE